ncbi:MAG: 3D-(3,5/4)-trihydroxycyclohexane-1,2-dione acylhydrolase (decyclizing) [Alphaproteobacteria bacterium]|nr:3D-(3,5/4)-trihydroxycyclohexane-1,2-dione acylhydrolase (decyclizing) [Alphaproteobacteria bacterium]
MATVRLTAAEAVVRYLAAQLTEVDDEVVPLFGGVFAIFGHGNVAGLGPALQRHADQLPTFRAHNEQAMAHAAIAYAKTYARRRMMACTTSIGPGATNLVTAAAVAHVNRLPVLLLPGDVFASRRPDPVLQQVEDFSDGTISANDSLRPVSRYWDRITRPEQILQALPAALRVLCDPVECGPVTLALPQDVQAEAFDYPSMFFRRRVWHLRRPPPDQRALEEAAAIVRRTGRAMIIAGGGIKYAGAEKALARFTARHRIPVAETQAGKGSLPADHPFNLGGIGVTGSAAANRLARQSDVIIAVGTRLSDFTTSSRALFNHARLIALNVAGFDAAKHDAHALVADARLGLETLSKTLGRWRTAPTWARKAERETTAWQAVVDRATAPPRRGHPVTDAQVLGAVNRAASTRSIVVGAAGGLPGELHRLWRAEDSMSYHLEYGYSCMGYEIAGGLGAKLAAPDRQVFVLVGDGSYLMMNSEIATSIALGAKLTIIVLDNRGFGCINRLQQATGGEPFNNLLSGPPAIDFAAHARSLGAEAHHVADIPELEAALRRAKLVRHTVTLVIETDPAQSTTAGGAWWDVPVTAAPRTSRERTAAGEYARALQPRSAR